jgi:hypothetical protein
MPSFSREKSTLGDMIG